MSGRYFSVTELEAKTLQAEDFLDALEEAFQKKGTALVAVTGGSMTPSLRPNRDYVQLRRCCPTDFRRGVILLYRRENGAIVLHRIRKVLPDRRLLMNGDAQAWCEQIECSQAVAAATECLRNGKRLACRGLKLRLWDVWWYPTRPFRPFMISLLRLFRKKNKQ